MATNYTVSLGDAIEQGGQDYGTYDAESAEGAVRAAARDADRTREYEAVDQLSESVDFGRGTPGVVNGNGAQNRDDWWYVEQDGRFVGIYVAREVRS